MKAFVAGATGETGRRIVQKLVKRNIPVRVLVRNVETARSILPAEVELVTGDILQRDSLIAALADSTVLLCATGASLKNEDNPDPILMSAADTLFDGSIPRTKVALVCVEALFQPGAKNKIVEIVAKPEAPAKDFPALFAGVA